MIDVALTQYESLSLSIPRRRCLDRSQPWSTGLGRYADVLSFSEELELFGMRCKVLALEGLIKNKQAVHRAKDLRLPPELEALLEIRESEKKRLGRVLYGGRSLWMFALESRSKTIRSRRASEKVIPSSQQRYVSVSIPDTTV